MDPLDGRNQVMTTQSTRNLLAVAPVILVLLLPLTNLGGGAPLGTVEKSWNQTFVVPATSGVALSGMLYLANTQVNGSFTVRSCWAIPRMTSNLAFSIMTLVHPRTMAWLWTILASVGIRAPPRNISYVSVMDGVKYATGTVVIRIP